MKLSDLQQAVAGNAAGFRSRVRLQPAGGEGDKVFPPTYSDATYAKEKRRVPGHVDPVECVLLDSVQSQANRIEEALQDAVDEGRIQIPVVEVDFSDVPVVDPERTPKGFTNRLVALQVLKHLTELLTQYCATVNWTESLFGIRRSAKKLEWRIFETRLHCSKSARQRCFWASGIPPGQKVGWEQNFSERWYLKLSG